MKTKNRTAVPTMPTAEPNIPCAMKPKRNTKKKEDRAKQKRMRVLLASLRAALERAARL